MIKDNLQKICDEIAITCKKNNKNPNEIEIVAASKTRSQELILECAKTAKIAAFGENRVQELLSKYTPEVTWDLIGQLQTNKVKYIIDKVRLIHSVDRISLLQEIDKQAAKIGKVQKILIEVNSGAEDCKGGVLLKDVNTLANECLQYKNVKLCGLMAVAPLVIEKEALKDLFLGVKEAYEALKRNFDGIKYLSMGMSNDFSLAIECGSNMIRPGRILFD